MRTSRAVGYRWSARSDGAHGSSVDGRGCQFNTAGCGDHRGCRGYNRCGDRGCGCCWDSRSLSSAWSGSGGNGRVAIGSSLESCSGWNRCSLRGARGSSSSLDSSSGQSSAWSCCSNS